MKIGIIGAGAIGSTIAKKLAAQGHNIKLANSKGPESIRDLAASMGVSAVSKEQAVRDVEVIVLSIPFANHTPLSSLFNVVPEDVVIIDTSNYYPFRDGAIKEVDDGIPESIWVSNQIGRPVIKAWNACLARTLSENGKPAGSTGRIALPVAGDNEEAKKVAMRLVDTTGFDALDTGALAESWRQQPGNPAYCTELTLEELRIALATAMRGRAANNREKLIKELMENYANLTHEDIVSRNRAVTAHQ